jgi:hypothetical protein
MIWFFWRVAMTTPERSKELRRNEVVDGGIPTWLASSPADQPFAPRAIKRRSTALNRNLGPVVTSPVSPQPEIRRPLWEQTLPLDRGSDDGS